MKGPIRVGCSPLTKKIYAGHVGARFIWLSDRVDVTNEAIEAIIQHVGIDRELTLTDKATGEQITITVRKVVATKEEERADG